MKRALATALVILSVNLSINFSAYARKSDGKVQISGTGHLLTCRVDKGYHFNKEAPASIHSSDGVFQASPTKKDETEIVFDAGKSGKNSFVLSFYVCDDAKTVCEEHNQKFETSADASSAPASGIAAQRASAKINPDAASTVKKLQINKNGFIEDNLWLALQKAKKQGQLVLVDFRAPWCPACIRLETEVFPQVEFKSATSSFVKVSLNVDVDSQKELSKKYQIKAIPTLLVMDNDGNEIYRSLDFKPTALLSAELAKIPSGKYLSYDSLKLEAQAGSQNAMLTLGQREFLALNYPEAVKWLSQIKAVDSLLFANSEVGFWAEKAEADPKNIKTYSEILEKWILQLPESFEAVVWRNEWAERRMPKPGAATLSSATKLVLEQNITKIKSTLASPIAMKKLFAKTYQGDFSGFEKVELMGQLASSYKILNQTEFMKATQKAEYAELQKIKLSTARPGQVLTALSYLRALEKSQEVHAWLEKLVKAYPNTYVYFAKMARHYYNDKKFDLALPLAQKVVQMEPGVALRNLQFVAEIQKAMNQKTEAQKTIDQALALPEAKLTQNKKQADALGELKKGL